MGIREGKKSNLSDWAKGHGAILVNKQPLCNWPWGDKNREDSTLSPIASAPWQARDYRLSFPIIPYLYTSYFQTPFKGGLAPREGIQLRAGTAPSQTVLHILCSLLLISTDKLGHLVPLSTSELGDGRHNRNGTSSWGGGREARQTCHKARWLAGKIFFKKLPISWKREKQNQTIYPVLSKHRGQRKDVRIYLYIYIYNFKIIPDPVPLTPLPLPPLSQGFHIPQKNTRNDPITTCY